MMTQIMSKNLVKENNCLPSSLRNNSKKMLPVYIMVISGLALVLCIYAVNGSQVAAQQQDNKGSAVVEEIGSKRASSGAGEENESYAEISTGMVNGVPYYHCAGSTKGQHLVLLHGARFTKKDWSTSGIMNCLCVAGREGSLSVSAMDLPVSAGHEDLKALLTAMQAAELLTTSVVLVTPSASGKTITDWMTMGDVNEIPSYISKWIPVAAGSVSGPSDEQVRNLVGKLPILAVYGSRDAMGKRVTERLANLASAETLEMEGGHPCYLENPDVFVAAVLQTMNISEA